MLRIALPLISLIAAPCALGEPDFARVREFLNGQVKQGTVAGGSIVVFDQGVAVLAEGFGFSDLELETPFELTTPVVIASISKPLIGTVAFRLGEKGLLDLSIPISTYLPEFRDRKLESGDVFKRAPTMIELLTHMGGIRAHNSVGGRPWFARWTFGKTLSEVVRRYAKEFPFEAQPGVRFAYSGIGTDVAARVLEVAAGAPRNELFVSELAEPLGMTQTFYRDATSLEVVGAMPTRYSYSRKKGLSLSRKRPVQPTNTYSSSGGAIISTATDLGKWLLMIRNHGQHKGQLVLSPESIKALLSDYPGSRHARGGLVVRQKSEDGEIILVGHSGSSGTNCWIDFENRIIAIVLTQTSGKPKAFRMELDKRITECVVSGRISK